MQKNTRPCYYGDYLQLDKLLDAQHPESKNYGKEAHDEMLFIIVHQAYELWFKQILHELHSVLDLVEKQTLPDKDIATVIHRLNRIQEVQRLLIDQITVLETMTPLDFLDFRDYLIPASGFQSIQFKEIEILLGLKSANRINFDQKSFYNRLNEKDRTHLLKLEEEPCLFDHIERWLERMPFHEYGEFKFWSEYRKAVDAMLASDRQIIENADYMTDAEKAFQLTDLERTGESFESLFDEQKFNRLKEEGKFRFNQKALLAAVFINLYRDEPMLQQPFQLLTALVGIDEQFTTWRYRHTIMVHRMLGTKIGTGGSSGHDYLKQTTENNRFFRDLFNLSTFLLPRSARPELPPALLKAMSFYLSAGE